MLGPQWLCACNESDGADTVEEAGAEAGQHFLWHHDNGETATVSVYKERNQWVHSISTPEQAAEAFKRANVAVGELDTKEDTTTFMAPFHLPAGATVEMKDSSGTSVYTVLSSVASAMGTMTHTVQKADRAARSFSEEWKKPVEIDPLPPVQRPARPMRGVDVGNMSFAEANATFAQMIDEQMRRSLASWNSIRGR
jgi:hypothetical protein